MDRLTKVQSIYFDLCDLALENPPLMKLKVKGLSEFETLGEFVEHQKQALLEIEAEVTEE